jgi:hypothetical protein
MHKQVDTLMPGVKQRLYHFDERKDHITVWKKPRKPQGMSLECYQRYPKTLQIREFKIEGKIYMTTLLDHKIYPKRELKQLYKRRWEIETHLNSIKTIMGMDTLSCKTPSMIRKEISIYLLAYNIIRDLMTQACSRHHKLAWQVSFKSTIQILEEFLPYLSNYKKKVNLYEELLRLIATKTVGNRPGRIEPRLLKQRRQKFPNLKQPRDVEQQKLILALNCSRKRENDSLELK